MPAKKNEDNDKKLKIDKKQVDILQEDDKKIIVRAKKGLSKGQFELLSDMLKSENEKIGYEIILMPYSVDTIDN
ncbi:MAG: hypothetical protein N4A63_12925 [Vallitalea sp.]|jgi:hypothetical protein|nr:hypothetical protein [Vallitalea sp.]